jgi:hypothetical protein
MSLVTRGELLTALGSAATISDSDLGLLIQIQIHVERLIKKFVGYHIEQRVYTNEFHPSRGLFNTSDPLVDGAWEMSGGRAMPLERYASDRRLLQLRELPVRSIQAVYENVAAWDTSPPQWSVGNLLQEGPDFQVDYEQDKLSWSGFVIRRTGVWTASDRAIRVDYTAGLTSQELNGATGTEYDYPEFKKATIDAVQIQFNTTKLQRFNLRTGQAPGVVSSFGIKDFRIAYRPTTLYDFENELPLVCKRMLEERVRQSKFISP